MKEDFLHYLWRFQYFDKQTLQTDEGEYLSVANTGHHNQHAGPDFFQARLRIGSMAWIGQVEIHLKASDWHRHGHQHDKAYENVILHVVWESDVPIFRQDGSLIPCLSLKSRVSPSLQQRYWNLLATKEVLPCQPHLAQLPAIMPITTLESAMVARLERRRLEWMKLLEQKKGDWKAVAYRQLARYLGGKLNDTPFIALSQKLPWQELQRHRGQLLRTEALVFGTAGLLQKPAEDNYQQVLKKEYVWMQQSQELSPIPFDWRWGRMRQGNFPTVRLAQLAALVCHRPQLFSRLRQVASLKEVKEILKVPISDYWQAHYHFGKARKNPQQWGIDNLIINWLVPFWYTYGSYTGNSDWQERAIHLLHELPAEGIQKLKRYQEAGFPQQQAADSQGALELSEYYCQPRKCLSCTIGVKVLATVKEEAVEG